MPTGPATTADDITDSIRALVERLADAKVTQEMAKRGQEFAGLLAERGADVGDRATEAWRETRPLRRDAAKQMSRATGEAVRWSDRTWRTALRPAIKELWKRRTLAIGAAGAAVPASRELVDTAAARLKLRQREERHWGSFFLGLLIGAAAGAIVALLTTPKRGSEMRHELGVKADEITAKAKEAEWVPIFQREGYDPTNGRPAAAEPATTAADVAADASGSVQEGAADAGTATGEAAEAAADNAAEAINESYETVDRESPA